MNLKEFVEGTLVEIAQVVEAANTRLNKRDEKLFAKYVLRISEDRNEYSKISFDVAVTSSKEGTVNANGEFNIFVVDADVSGNAKISNQIGQKLVGLPSSLRHYSQSIFAF